jgi:hypothetical protein
LKDHAVERDTHKDERDSAILVANEIDPSDRERQQERERQRETERDRERQRETEIDRERQRETDRDRAGQ